jgi:hypothetical protein
VAGVSRGDVSLGWLTAAGLWGRASSIAGTLLLVARQCQGLQVLAQHHEANLHKKALCLLLVMLLSWYCWLVQMQQRQDHVHMPCTS